MAQPPRVFISYSHDDENHARRIRTLADRLKSEGLEILFDQYDPHPAMGWPMWMQNALDSADYVLMVCTETYLRRVEQREVPGTGRGVLWEGGLIYNQLYLSGPQGKKFIPILLEGSDMRHIPQPLQAYANYRLKTFDRADGYFAKLVQYLTGRSTAATDFHVRSLRLGFSQATVGAGYQVRLECDGAEPAEAEFACNPRSERTTSELLAAIEQDKCSEEDLRFVGAQLWGGLISGPVQARYKQQREEARGQRGLFHFRLRLPRELEDLPWESLYDTAFLSSDERSCIIRETPEEIDPPSPRNDRNRPLGILLLMPSGTELDLTREREQIVRWAVEQGDSVRVEVLDEQVTPERIRARINSGDWDIVHFAGHAMTNDHGTVSLRLHGDLSANAETWMDAERFATLFSQGDVRLVVLNCCHGAHLDASLSRALSGLGPFLMRRGVAAVVAMRYEIPDRVALRFSDEFYRMLLTGPEPGRIDLAVESGRAVVYQNEPGTVRGFITPVLYLAEGHHRAFELAPVKRSFVADIGGASCGDQEKYAALDLPEGLIDALRENRCIPVLGPGLLTSEAVRSGEGDVAPGPRELARALAELSHYPRMDDFLLSERGGAWLDGFVLQWVCQHLFSQRNIRHEMLKTIKKVFQNCRPPSAIAKVAQWTVPGFLCTYFDGLLAQAAQEQGRKIQARSALLDEAPVDSTAPLLIQLRGTWKDDRSLVLTEDLHNQLWDRLAVLPEWISNLLQGDYGRSLLFLGVHPRDPLARRLCAKLINEQTKLRVGPVYFACPTSTVVDECYWDNFDVQWLRGDSETVIDALSAATEARPAP